MSGERGIVLPPALQAGKAATRALVAAVGGQEAAALYAERSQGRISTCCGPNTDAFLPIDAVRALEGVTHGHPSHPAVTRWLAREAGYGLVRLPDAGQPETKWSLLASRLAKEGGELMAGVCEDLSSENDISPAEAKRRLGDAADLVRVAVELEAALKARAGEAG